MTILISMMIVALAMGFWLCILLGLGLLGRRLVGGALAEFQDLHRLPWFGWCWLIALLQVWHLWLPVDWRALLLVTLLALVGWWSGRREIALVCGRDKRKAFVFLASVVAVLLFVANHSLMQPWVYDSGLYHLNAVRWTKEFAIVPGLGNLHARLAFNNASFLYTALLDVGNFAHRSHQLASGILIAIVLHRCSFAAFELCKRGRVYRVETIYYALLLAPLIVWTVTSGSTSSPSPDVPCYLLAIVIGGELLSIGGRCGSAKAMAEGIAVLALLVVTGTVVKLSFAAFGGVALIMALLRVRGAMPRRDWYGSHVCACLIGLSVLLPWSVRGIILSGYPAYPAAFGRMPVRWAVSEASVRDASDRIRAWAMAPGVDPALVLGNADWIGPWFRRLINENAFSLLVPLLLALVGALLLIRCCRDGAVKGTSQACHAPIPVVAAVASGVLYWLLTAPDARFLGSQPWVLGTAVLAGALTTRPNMVPPVTLAVSVVVGLLYMNPLDVICTWKDPSLAKRVPMKPMTTNSGLTVYVPAAGDQAWDSNLPATPYYNARLQLRDASDMSKGFVLRAKVAETPTIGTAAD